MQSNKKYLVYKNKDFMLSITTVVTFLFHCLTRGMLSVSGIYFTRNHGVSLQILEVCTGPRPGPGRQMKGNFYNGPANERWFLQLCGLANENWFLQRTGPAKEKYIYQRAGLAKQKWVFQRPAWAIKNEDE